MDGLINMVYINIILQLNQKETELKKVDKNIRVAVMGCEVNGPGEAKDADIGIAAGVGKAIIFRKGKKVKVVAEQDMLSALMEEIEKKFLLVFMI